MPDLARAAGVSLSTVKRMEAEGSPPPSGDMFRLVRDALEARGVRFSVQDGYGRGVHLRGR